jgi:hypothetical protein
MKREVDNLNAVPSKRIYRSIIADYNLNTAISELVDNVLDSRGRHKLRRKVEVTIEMDLDDQSITITDNAGGLAEAELSKLISPGSSLDAGDGGTIGIFGVGSKRAVVALARDIKVKTRSGEAPKTFQIEYDDSWLETEDWNLPYYEIDTLPKSTTRILLSRLRFRIESSDMVSLSAHLSCTYARFLARNELSIVLK